VTVYVSLVGLILWIWFMILLILGAKEKTVWLK
jgi:hypothetical protein